MLAQAKRILTSKKGQSAAEYIIVTAGLVAAFLTFYVLYSHLVPQEFDQGAKLILTDYTTN